MIRRRPLSYLAEIAVGALCFERRPADPLLVSKLRTEVAELSRTSAGGGDGIVADQLWEAKRAELRHLLATGDPQRFLRWPPVRTTMVKRGHRPVTVEFRHLRRRADWRARWRPALREMTLGRPRPFPRLPTTSPNALHLAYHLCRFEEATGVRPETATFIVEFGGGYGGMCRLLHRLGFRGQYVIFDLPEVSLLQRFYLGHTPECRPAPAGRMRPIGVAMVSALDDLRRLVTARSGGTALFIATWSLAETPTALREPVLLSVSDFDAFLLGYASRFADIDNRSAFGRWRAALPGLAWQELSLPHLGKAEWYLFGARPELARPHHGAGEDGGGVAGRRG